MNLGREHTGCAVGVLRTGPAAGRLVDIRRLGFDCIEVQFGDDARDAENAPFIEATRRDLAATGLEVWSVHAPFGKEYDVSVRDAAIRLRGIEAAIRAAGGCVTLGGRVVIVHCGDELPPDDPGRADALARSAESIARIVEKTAPLSVRIALENLPPNYLTSTASELLGVVERFPASAVGVCLDTGHAHIAGRRPDDGGYTDIGLVRQVAGRLATTHLHDNDGSDDQHLVPGSGTIDWATVGGALAASPYAGPLMFEVSGPGSHAEALMRLPAAARMIRSYR